MKTSIGEYFTKTLLDKSSYILILDIYLPTMVLDSEKEKKGKIIRKFLVLLLEKMTKHYTISMKQMIYLGFAVINKEEDSQYCKSMFGCCGVTNFD